MDLSMLEATSDGYAPGLVVKSTGLPIRKPWSVATTAPILLHVLLFYNCARHAKTCRVKTRTYHGRVASGRTAGWRGRVGHDCSPT